MPRGAAARAVAESLAGDDGTAAGAPVHSDTLDALGQCPQGSPDAGPAERGRRHRNNNSHNENSSQSKQAQYQFRFTVRRKHDSSGPIKSTPFNSIWPGHCVTADCSDGEHQLGLTGTSVPGWLEANRPFGQGEP